MSPLRALPSSTPIPIAVIGYGRMGQRHARALARLPEFHLAGIVDVDCSLEIGRAHV